MGFLQTTIRMSLQTIIWMHQCIANNHLDGLAFCKWSSGFLPFNQILLHFYFYFQQISYFPPTNIIFSFNKFLLLLQILGSRFNFAVLVNLGVLKSLLISVCTACSFSGSPQNHFSVPLTKHGCKNFFLSQMGSHSSASLTLLNSLRCTSVVAEVFRVASYLYFWSTRALAKNCEF